MISVSLAFTHSLRGGSSLMATTEKQLAAYSSSSVRSCRVSYSSGGGYGLGMACERGCALQAMGAARYVYRLHTSLSGPRS